MIAGWRGDVYAISPAWDWCFVSTHEDDRGPYFVVAQAPATFAYLEPWEPIPEDHRVRIETEIARELPPNHVLAGRTLRVVAARSDCDDLLCEVTDLGYAVVHATWSGHVEQSREWPRIAEDLLVVRRLVRARNEARPRGLCLHIVIVQRDSTIVHRIAMVTHTTLRGACNSFSPSYASTMPSDLRARAAILFSGMLAAGLVVSGEACSTTNDQASVDGGSDASARADRVDASKRFATSDATVDSALPGPEHPAARRRWLHHVRHRRWRCEVLGIRRVRTTRAWVHRHESASDSRYDSQHHATPTMISSTYDGAMREQRHADELAGEMSRRSRRERLLDPSKPSRDRQRFLMPT